ncbi:glycoside hydrolase family 3 C-terminal domain-containing protein [Nocardia fusca]|uniref:Glycoside hydrolase family 3 C-terminal domain-containing protein n=1 Tax=Nocardia fusca TaxID=941183 RepID=A0ABV3FGP4_9NOCA
MIDEPEVTMTPSRLGPTPRAPRTVGSDRFSLLSGKNFWQTADHRELGARSVRMADGPHGLRVQGPADDHLGLAPSVPATCFPTAVTLASSWDPELVAEVGAAVAREARVLGVGMVLGPGLNIKRHPFCGRNFEYFSEDPLLSGLLAAAAVRGIQSVGVGACLKHFAVNNQEHRRFVIDAVVDERTLRELYLRGFEIAVRTSAPRMVMASYNLVNGVHATENRHLLTDILRTEWGFTGAVVSDWGAVSDPAASVAAGMDLEMPGGLDRHGDLAAALAAGTLTDEDIDTSVTRILALADLAFGEPAQGLPADMAADHDALARRAAAAATVVLHNDGVLPLSGTERIALIGAFAEQPRYQGSGSSLVVPTRLTTAVQAFGEAGLAVTYEPGYDPRSSAPDEALIERAVRAARSADIAVVLVGLPAIHESEGFDRTTLALPVQHDALVAAVAAANPRTVVVLSNGSPLAMPWLPQVAAVLEGYLGGQAAGGALVDALTGAVEPAGRLAETFPARQEEISADPYFPGGNRQVKYREGIFVGYRHAVTAGITPLFPFGHGLGYGRTEWSGVRADTARADVSGTVRISVDVANIGERPTSEVVQVYAHDRTGVVQRPRRELAGFARVTLRPGEVRTVTVPVRVRDLAFWDVRAGGWRVPTGTFVLEVGYSSERIAGAVEVDVLGETTDAAEPPARPAISASDVDFARRLGRPVPVERPLRPFTRESTVGDIATTVIGCLLRRLMNIAVELDETTKADPVAMAMIARTTDEMPLRALVQFSRGRMSWRLIDVVLAIANRSPAQLARALAGAGRR